MYFPANEQDCICCIHHYIFVCIYSDVTVYGTVTSKSENTGFILSFWSSLTHGLRQCSPNSPVNVRAYVEIKAEAPAHGWVRRGSQATMARAVETIRNILRARGICHCRHALSVKRRAELQSEEEGQSSKWGSFVSHILRISSSLSLGLSWHTRGSPGLHKWHRWVTQLN